MYVLYVSQNFQELNEHFLIPMGGAIHHDSRPRSLKPHPLERLEACMWKTLPVSLGNIYISGGFSTCKRQNPRLSRKHVGHTLW